MDIFRSVIRDQTNPQGGYLFRYDMYTQSSWYGIRVSRNGELFHIYTGKEKYIEKMWDTLTKGAVRVPVKEAW